MLLLTARVVASGEAFGYDSDPSFRSTTLNLADGRTLRVEAREVLYAVEIEKAS